MTPETTEPPAKDARLPTEWPAALDLWLASITGRNRAEKLSRLRACLAEAMERRGVGGEANVKAAFIRLQREGLGDVAEWSALSAQFAQWWGSQRAETLRRNRQGETKKA